MSQFFSFSPSSRSVVYSKLKTLLGSLLCILSFVFFIVSIPVYIFRLIVVQLAKWFRPDLGGILNGQSCMFVTDYFAKTAPRSNVVLVFHLQGIVTYEDLKNRAMAGLIQARDKLTGRLLFEKLQQYPVKWLGFSFWKKAYSTFSIDDHVYKHSGMDTQLTDDQLTSLVEKLLNTRFSKGKSPWEFHVIENYQPEENSAFTEQKKKQGGRAVLIFKIHHCLADGTGILKLLIEGLRNNYSLDDLKRPKFREINRTFAENLYFWLLFPVSAVAEMSYGLSHTFKSNPWKVADKDKKWKQVYVKSELIPIGLVKEIKNTFGVTFTSVLLSLISGAVHKSAGTKTCNTVDQFSQTWPYMSLIPDLSGGKNRETLENHFSAIGIDLPSRSFASPLERLQVVFRMLEKSKNSVAPLLFQTFTTLMGAHLLEVTRILGKNRHVPIALTNFAATPENDLTLHEHAKIVQIDSAVGGMSGNFGVVIAVVSHNGYIRLNVTAEEAIMTHAEAKQFTKYLKQELEALRDLMLKQKLRAERNSHLIGSM